MSIHKLNVPIARESLEGLKPGDCISITGRMFTCRPLAYDRLLDEAQGREVLEQLKASGTNVLFHCGPLVRKEGTEWKILGMVPMPSWLAGKERISKAVDLLGLRLIIGKGSLHELADLCLKAGCVHAVCAGNFNDYGLKVKRVVGGYWMELGLPEALWVFEADDFGPFIVETDTKGRSLYKEEDETFKIDAGSILEELEIKLD